MHKCGLKIRFYHILYGIMAVYKFRISIIIIIIILFSSIASKIGHISIRFLFLSFYWFLSVCDRCVQASLFNPDYGCHNTNKCCHDLSS